MPIIHSDTDTDNDNSRNRMRSLDRNKRNPVRRNESNSSASISRNNSLKGNENNRPDRITTTTTRDDRVVDSGSDFDESDFEEDPELNAADIPDTWYAFTDQKNNPNVKGELS